MEQVLDTYEKPYDPACPVLCMDEQPVQLVKETRQPIPATKRHAQRIDYEYERAGTASIFMFAEPLAGWREATARPSKTKADWAVEVARLLEGRYRSCPTVTLVCDNLNTHTIGAFYEAFSAGARPCVGPASSLLPHTQTWQLAQHCGERTELTDPTMRFRTPLRHSGDPAIRDRRLVTRCQQHATRGRLANESQRRPLQTQIPLPENQRLTEH